MPAASPDGVAFLLAQLGAHAAEQFGQRAAAAGFTRPQAGLLRLVAARPGQSQQAIAGQLGTPPSQLVAMIDELEQRGLVERRRNPDDRRQHQLTLTDVGQQALREIGTAAQAHEKSITAPLTAHEYDQLAGLLRKLADAHDLTPGVHPGYRHLRASNGRPDPG